MAVLTIGMLLCISVPAIHRTTTTKKAAQALIQRVASENAAVTGLYGKEKRPDNVPVTSGESVAASNTSWSRYDCESSLFDAGGWGLAI